MAELKLTKGTFLWKNKLVRLDCDKIVQTKLLKELDTEHKVNQAVIIAKYHSELSVLYIGWDCNDLHAVN